MRVQTCLGAMAGLALASVCTPAMAGLVGAGAQGSAQHQSLARAGLVDITAPGTTLQDVLDGGGRFRVADKLFTITNYFSVAFDASEIGIVALDFGLAGRGFRLTDAWADVPGNATASNFTLSYSVEIVDEPAFNNFFIVDNRLIFNGHATGAGSFARVDETVLDEFGALLGNKSVFSLGDGTQQLSDELFFFPGVKKLNIVKDAQFFAPLADGTAGASFIDQTFSQIPAPGSLALLAAGGLLAARRRR